MTKNIFRCLPRITTSSSIEWVEWVSLTGFEQFLHLLGATNTSLAELLKILLQRLSQMPSVDQRSFVDKQVISALQSFAAWTVLSNLCSLRIGIWAPLNLYHPNASIDFDTLLQMSILEIIANKSDKYPINLMQGFELQNHADAEWNLPDGELKLGRHPFQQFIKKKHQYLLIGSIRKIEGAQEFKRTNYGLLKRCSTIKVGEALKRAGIRDVANMLILHRSLRDAIVNRKFSSSKPTEENYLYLHHAYQQNLAAKATAKCSLLETKKRLDQLGSAVRSYGNSRMITLNDASREHKSELIHRLSAESFDNAFDELIDREHRQQAQQLKTKIYNQLSSLRPVQLEAFCLSALGYNDSQVAVYQNVSACTIKRRRGRIICQIINISLRSKEFKAIDVAYLQVVEDYFIPEITVISRTQLHISRDMLEAIDLIVEAINSRWNLNLCLNERLQRALQKMFEQEGVA
jgi:hypothetical protein